MSPIRRSVLVGAGTALASAAGPVPAFAAAEPRVPSDADADIEDLVSRASQGHAALMVGDVGRYRAFIKTSADFTLLSPFGGAPTRGGELSDERWASVGRFFKNGRNATLQLIQAYPSADMVVLAAVERAHVEVGGLAGQDWALRVTLVFRREGEQWQLVHRHADPIAAGISLEQAAALGRR